MTTSVSTPQASKIWLIARFCFLASFAPALTSVATGGEKLPVVSKWQRFEQSFKSGVAYTNPVQQCALTVVFVSPVGTTNEVHGFWDGGRTWRVRFSPDQVGHWTYRATCSDSANEGLHQSGAFICSSTTGKSRFNLHGPVRTALDRRHFQHADGTQFFWLADETWDGASKSELKDWEAYASVRAGQKFTAIQWSLAGEDPKKQTAFAGKERISINPGFFQRLDAKVEALNRAGLLSVILIGGEQLPEDQAALFNGYLVARWGADDTAWVIGAEHDKSLGRATFPQTTHGPVIVTFLEQWIPDEWRDERWVDAFGIRNETLFPPPTKDVGRPVLDMACPPENVVNPNGERITADTLRRVVWPRLLKQSSAGIVYSVRDVVNWNSTVDPQSMGSERPLPAWYKSLFLPGAKQMIPVAELFNSIAFWRLRPTPQHVMNQPGTGSPGRMLSMASSDTKDVTVVYVPQDRTVEIALAAFPLSPQISWINPRTGEKSTAVAVVGASSCQFPTPDPGDWVLLIRSGK